MPRLFKEHNSSKIPWKTSNLDYQKCVWSDNLTIILCQDSCKWQIRQSICLWAIRIIEKLLSCWKSCVHQCLVRKIWNIEFWHSIFHKNLLLKICFSSKYFEVYLFIFIVQSSNRINKLFLTWMRTKWRRKRNTALNTILKRVINIEMMKKKKERKKLLVIIYKKKGGV